MHKVTMLLALSLQLGAAPYQTMKVCRPFASSQSQIRLKRLLVKAMQIMLIVKGRSQRAGHEFKQWTPNRTNSALLIETQTEQAAHCIWKKEIEYLINILCISKGSNYFNWILMQKYSMSCFTWRRGGIFHSGFILLLQLLLVVIFSTFLCARTLVD